MFKTLYILFLVSITWYANTRLIGPLSVRHIMTVIMFIACNIKNNTTPWTDKYLNKYLVFALLFGISSFVTGFADSYLIYVFRNIPTLVVAYWATRILKEKYNSISVFVYTLLTMGLLNSIVAIGQFFYIPFLNQLPDILHISIDSEFLEMQGMERDLIGFTLPGLMISTVTNGYFTMVVAILFAYVYNQKMKLLILIPWGITMVASYFVQERGPFFIALLISLYLFYTKVRLSLFISRPFLIAIFLVLSTWGISVLYSFFVAGESRFALGLDSTNRDVIYDKAINFISDNFLLGGLYKSLTLGGPPHNLILNAWIYGGIFGAVMICWLVIQQLKEIIKVLTKGVSIYNYRNIVIGLAFIAYTLNSFLHNLSVVTGDSLIWMLWGAYYYQANNKN